MPHGELLKRVIANGNKTYYNNSAQLLYANDMERYLPKN